MSVTGTNVKMAIITGLVTTGGYLVIAHFRNKVKQGEVVTGRIRR